MTLLTLVQDSAVKIGIAKPNSVVGNTDIEVQELLTFAKEESYELMRQHYWQALRKEKTVLTVATEEQSDLPSDFDRFVNETFWNRTRKHPLWGPLNAEEWQYNKNWTSSPVTDSFTIRGNKILINPVPAAGQTLAYEYISKNYCKDNIETEQDVWSNDTDVSVLPEHIVTLGVIVRFKLAKGLDASSDIAKYDTQLQLHKSYESPKRTLSMATSGKVGRIPNIITPEGDWPI